MYFCHFPPAECPSLHDDDVSLEQVGHDLTTKQQQKHTQTHDDAGEACGGDGGLRRAASEGTGGDGRPAEGWPVRVQAGTGGLWRAGQ